jgi:hypothetical protein
MLKSIQKQLTDAEINPKFFNFVLQSSLLVVAYGDCASETYSDAGP